MHECSDIRRQPFSAKERFGSRQIGFIHSCAYHRYVCRLLHRNRRKRDALRGACASEKGMRHMKMLIHGAVLAAAPKDAARALTVRELLHHADTGVGAVSGTKDAVIFEDSVAYRALMGGGIEIMQPLEGLAFGTAVRFDETVPSAMLTCISDLAAFKSALQIYAQDDAGACYIMKASGMLRTVRVSNHPFGSAAKVPQQALFENTRGSVVGMYLPACAKSAGSPEWQFYYLSGDKTQGGFVLDLSADCLHMKLNKIKRPDLLPHSQKENERKP